MTQLRKPRVGVLTFSDGREYAHEPQIEENLAFQEGLQQALEAKGFEVVAGELVWSNAIARQEATKLALAQVDCTIFNYAVWAFPQFSVMASHFAPGPLILLGQVNPAKPGMVRCSPRRARSSRWASPPLEPHHVLSAISKWSPSLSRIGSANVTVEVLEPRAICASSCSPFTLAVTAAARTSPSTTLRMRMVPWAQVSSTRVPDPPVRISKAPQPEPATNGAANSRGDPTGAKRRESPSAS